jgi:hypothetical protein
MYDVVTKCYNYEGCPLALDRIKQFGMEVTEYRKMVAHISCLLTSYGPMTTVDISKHIEKTSSTKSKVKVKMYSTSGKWSTSQSNVGISVHAMFSEAKLLYGLHHNDDHSHDTWKSQTRLYGIASLDVCNGEGGMPLAPSCSAPTEADYRALMCWYFDLYSPASLQDFVWWSGKRITESRAALNHLLDEGVVQEIVVDEMPQTLYISTRHVQDLVNCPDIVLTGSVRFLPYEDAIIKAYKETRYRFFHAENSEKMKTTNIAIESLVMLRGEAMPTVWKNGQIIGKWKWETGGRAKKAALATPPAIVITTLSKLSKSSIDELHDELTELCSMLGVDPDHDVIYQCDA